jgi:hypothetical protein
MTDEREEKENGSKNHDGGYRFTDRDLFDGTHARIGPVTW